MKSKVVSLRFTEEELANLDELSRIWNMSRSDTIRKLIQIPTKEPLEIEYNPKGLAGFLESGL
jgi:metal-responsive CopG/Arc/MetJ family transcriptional regulator